MPLFSISFFTYNLLLFIILFLTISSSVFLFPPNFLLRLGLVVIIHADRFKTSRTNAKQSKSDDVDGEKKIAKESGILYMERWERLCVEAARCPEKTGGFYKRWRVTVISQIFVCPEVKAECVYFTIVHRVLISSKIDNSWDWILNFHTSIHPPIYRTTFLPVHHPFILLSNHLSAYWWKPL